MTDIIRGMDSSGEPLYGEGSANYFQGNNSIAMNVITRLKSVMGDCFFDQNANLDWDNILGSRDYPQARVDEDVKRTVLETDEVASIVSFESYIKDRTYNANFTITTDNSTDELSIEFNTEGITEND